MSYLDSPYKIEVINYWDLKTIAVPFNNWSTFPANIRFVYNYSYYKKNILNDNFE
jgi:hypothetical protein